MIKTKYQSALLSFKFSWSDSSGAASKIMDNQSTYLFEGWSKQLCWMLVISLKYYWDMILTYKYSTQHAGFWIEITDFFAKLWSFHISNLSKSCCLNAQLIYINSKDGDFPLDDRRIYCLTKRVSNVTYHRLRNAITIKRLYLGQEARTNSNLFSILVCLRSRWHNQASVKNKAVHRWKNIKLCKEELHQR